MVEVKAQEKKIMRGIKGRITDKSEDNSSIKKERRIVVWSQEEDDILREQMGVHGTDSWTTIASIFKDKTPRQCRRRWYTYLNSDFKKGGWMPEEDVLLCKAQKIFGNRWTEIAKVVSGRTDNAVKNRFTTLCKKRARSEASTKENDFPFANSNNKRVMPCKRGIDSAPDDILDPKRARLQSMGVMEIHTLEDRLHVPKKTALNQSIRSPFSILVQNINKQNSTQQEINTVTDNEDGYEIRGTFLCKDDPKIAVLMQQAELLSSLALKVNEESTYQALENAWKVLEEFLNQNKDRRLNKENALDFGVILKGLRSIYNGRQNQIYAPDNYRRPELCDESSLSSECSTGSTAYQSPDNFQFREGLMNEGKAASDSSNAEFGFPFPVTPLFRSLAAGIPSPKFSESERNFIMKTLGMDSPSAMPSANPSRNSTCKRALLQHL